MVKIVNVNLFVCFILPVQWLFSQEQLLEKRMHHLRFSSEREWDNFPTKAKKQLEIIFRVSSNNTDQTLQLRQEDVRQNWVVELNGKAMGKLQSDENPMIRYLPVPAGLLVIGENRLIIKQTNSIKDDIRIGDIRLLNKTVGTILTEGFISISITDRQSGSLLPGRITVVNDNYALQPVQIQSGGYDAVREGCIYTGNGKANFTLPGGRYTIYANRGFEYGVDSFSILVRPGDRIEKKLVIEEEVPTEGWIASDPHIHTFTFSGHGDATLTERAITIAGEGIELPVLTDHNVHVDIDSAAISMKVRSFFTPVIGNEFTTPVGHFNLFPVKKESMVQNHRIKNWNEVKINLQQFSDTSGVILNHARDVHNNFRPFGTERHLAIAGMDLEGQMFPANAMEVLNSSSQQQDYMQLFFDWFGMLNRGHTVTPVGSSDSHDVARYLVGQGRTYIRYEGNDPGNIDIRKATDSFLAGKVMISFGLLSEITVDTLYGPGDLAHASSQINVKVRVLGPAWINARRVTLYANGRKIRETNIQKNVDTGVKWSGSWTIPVTGQDMFLVAIAEGPGENIPFWQVPKPYQRTSSDWNPKVIGASGAVWIDGDKNGKKNSAYDYALSLISASSGDPDKIVIRLASYDEAVSIQAATILQQQKLLTTRQWKKALRNATPSVRSAFRLFSDEWERSQPSK